MAMYEQNFRNLQGNSYENELAKITFRYQNEGKPEVSSIDAKKKKNVRINEEAREYRGDNENRI